MSSRSGVIDRGGPGMAPPTAPLPVDIAADEQARLLLLARLAVRAAVRAGPMEDLRSALAETPLPSRQAGAFVTLTDGGELRGCMGTLDETAPAWRSVLDAARLAVLGDPRFEPVAPRELARLRLEISVLGPMTRLADPAAFRPGTDGILVERGRRRGLLLPEVANMLEPRSTAMLDAVCRKAGLAVDAWRDRLTELWVFRTCRFGGAVEPYHGAEEGGG